MMRASVAHYDIQLSKTIYLCLKLHIYIQFYTSCKYTVFTDFKRSMILFIETLLYRSQRPNAVSRYIYMYIIFLSFRYILKCH